MAVKIIRATNSSVLDIIRPLLLTDSDYSHEAFEDMIRQALLNQPEQIFILVALDTDPNLSSSPEINQVVQGFVIAYAPINTDHTFLFQAYAKPDADKSISKTAFLHLITWSRAIGRNKIKAETTRNTEAFHRRWGFSVTSQIMTFDIEQYEQQLVDLIERKASNVNDIETKDNVDPQCQSKDNRPEPQPTDQCGTVSGSETIRSTSDTGSDISSATSSGQSSSRTT